MPTGSTLQPLQHTYLSPPFEEAQVVDAMRVGLFGCAPDTPLQDVARMMATYHIHVVVVSAIGADHHEASAWGVVSDLDLARFASSMAGQTAGSVASTEIVTVAADESLQRAAQLMAEHETSHLIVVQPQSGHPVGMLSTLDLAGVLAWGQPG